MLLTLSFALLLLLAPVSLAIEARIIEPANGTRIEPGASFPFKYQSMGDYGVTSYNFTVWLFTQPPETFQSSQIWAGGYNFGRFAEPNYPGVSFYSSTAALLKLSSLSSSRRESQPIKPSSVGISHAQFL